MSEKCNKEICESLNEINVSIKGLKPSSKSKINNLKALQWVSVGVALIYILYKITF